MSELTESDEEIMSTYDNYLEEEKKCKKVGKE